MGACFLGFKRIRRERPENTCVPPLPFYLTLVLKVLLESHRGCAMLYFIVELDSTDSKYAEAQLL